MLSVGAALLAGLAPSAVRAAPADEEYYMITFMSGLEYWKSCYAGFQDAAKIYGVKTAYTGAQQFDINQQVTVLEQVAAKRPAGITITVVNAEALVKPIDSGIPVIIFDSDSPNSKRPSIVQTGNERAGRSAADALAAKVGEAGNVAVLVVPGTPTLEARAAGFKAQIAEKYPKMKVVATGNYDGGEATAAKAAAGIMQANPDLKGMFAGNSPGGLGIATAVREAGKKGQTAVVGFDADQALLEKIKTGEVAATVAQGSYNQGYWAMNLLYQYKHKLMNPIAGWDKHGLNPLPPYVDTGVFVITKENVDVFAAK
jgi:ribose transport system substrate-binding protein